MFCSKTLISIPFSCENLTLQSQDVAFQRYILNEQPNLITHCND